jgi:hypothetical protein
LFVWFFPNFLFFFPSNFKIHIISWQEIKKKTHYYEKRKNLLLPTCREIPVPEGLDMPQTLLPLVSMFDGETPGPPPWACENSTSPWFIAAQCVF